MSRYITDRSISARDAEDARHCFAQRSVNDQSSAAAAGIRQSARWNRQRRTSIHHHLRHYADGDAAKQPGRHRLARCFDIGAGETTQFLQPSSSAIAVNRVNSTTFSSIYGNLTANGNIVLINPKRNLVRQHRQSRCQRPDRHTTADLDNAQFMNGRPAVFSKPGNPNASIVNNGTITAAQAGLARFRCAHIVVNNGVITARNGTVAVQDPADTATVDFYGDGLMEVAVSDQVTSQLVANNGLIQADGGTVALDRRRRTADRQQPDYQQRHAAGAKRRPAERRD